MSVYDTKVENNSDSDLGDRTKSNGRRPRRGTQRDRDDETPGANENPHNGRMPPQPGDYRSTCERIDLTPYLDGTIKPVKPTLGPRSDGIRLLYRGKMHSLVGESEAGKTWLALLWCALEILTGHDVLFIDCEDGPEGIAERLLDLGLTVKQIQEHFIYVRPELVLNVAELKKLARRCTLTVLDGITEAMAMSPDEDHRDWNTIWVSFLTSTLRPIARTGTALLGLDHPTKADGKEPSRHASGAGHKLRGLDGAQYILHATEPVGRGMRGTAKVYIAKDRPGYLREYGMFIGGKVQMTQIATMTVDSSGTGSGTTVTLGQPVAEEFRPTTLMVRISQAAASEPDAWQSKSWLASQVTGTKAYLLRAVDILAAEGYLTTRQARADRVVYQHAKPFTGVKF